MRLFGDIKSKNIKMQSENKFLAVIKKQFYGINFFLSGDHGDKKDIYGA